MSAPVTDIAGARQRHQHDQLTVRYADGCIPDSTRLLMELAGQHAKGVLADTTDLLALAQARVQEIPSQPKLIRQVAALERMVGELLVRVAVLEHDLEERDKAARRRAGRRG